MLEIYLRKSKKTQFGVFSMDGPVKREDFFHIGVKIIAWVQCLTDDDLLCFKIKTHWNDWHMSLLGDEVESGPQLRYFLARTFGRHGENEFLMPVENPNYLLHHILARSTFNRMSTQGPPANV